MADCPSPRADGRQDRCGLFAAPPRCTPDTCTATDATADQPTGLMPRATPDRRQGPRRQAEQHLHLARELVLLKAKETADTSEAPGAWQSTDVGERLAELRELVALLRDAEEAARP